MVRAGSVKTGPAVGDESVIAERLVIGIVSVAEVDCVLSSKTVSHKWLEPGEKNAPLVVVCGLGPEIVRVIGFEC